MAVDTPATIVVLGGGPIGLEAALYGRFLGYDVRVFERGRVAENVRQLDPVPMAAPLADHRSTLGLAALFAQDPDLCTPHEDTLLTPAQWVAQYLDPLSKTDLLSDSVQTHATVVSVKRRASDASDDTDQQEPSVEEFEIAWRSEGRDQQTRGDVVIDATGLIFDAQGKPTADTTLFPGWPVAEWDCFRPGIPRDTSPQALRTPEPNFYVLGSKLHGGAPDFCFTQGLVQIRDLFTILGDRAELDLYESTKNLLP